MSMLSTTTWSNSLVFTFEEEAFLELGSHFAHLPGTCMLYSGGLGNQESTSYLFLFPKEIITVDVVEGAWDRLRDYIGELNGSLIPKWVGYFAFEMAEDVEKDKKNSCKIPLIPYAYFQQSKVSLVYDHVKRQLTVYSEEEFYLREEYWLSFEPLQHSMRSAFLTQELVSEEQYIEKIKIAKEYILEGEIYQVNLSHTVHMKGDIDGFVLFKKLVLQNGTAFSSYFNTPYGTIISLSPEQLLKKRGKTIETRPIKGTAPRGNNPFEDQKNKEDLLNSIKERSELLMITDLCRNDLGRISTPGSVNVKESFCIQQLSNVFHLYSIIQSTVKEMHPVDIMRLIFPGGSITGCPKLRAIEIINELEEEPRSIYTGSIGLFFENGDFDFNIAIRTLLKRGCQMELKLGGGIVLDSDPKREYEETLHKGKTFFEVCLSGLMVNM